MTLFPEQTVLLQPSIMVLSRHSHTAVNGEAELVCRLLRVSGVFVGAGQANSWGGTAAEGLFVQCLTEGRWKDGWGGERRYNTAVITSLSRCPSIQNLPESHHYAFECIKMNRHTKRRMRLFKRKEEKRGLVRDLNPGPLAPKARIIPLDQRATLHKYDLLHYIANYISFL